MCKQHTAHPEVYPKEGELKSQCFAGHRAVDRSSPEVPFPLDVGELELGLCQANGHSSPQGIMCPSVIVSGHFNRAVTPDAHGAIF